LEFFQYFNSDVSDFDIDLARPVAAMIGPRNQRAVTVAEIELETLVVTALGV
jgi:hypothetical protein